jgi:hypothetical protein
MSLAKGTVNPLNVLGQRKLSYFPKHFARMSIKADSDKISSWVYSNLNSRYAIKRTLRISEDNRMVETQEIGFEDASELTMFSLACPYLNQL